MRNISIFAIFLTAAVFTSQAADMKGMDRNNTHERSTSIGAKNEEVHRATGTVREVDITRGRVIIRHGPVKTLNWSGITMMFRVEDTTLFERLIVGRDVDFEFIKRGGDYVITAVK